MAKKVRIFVVEDHPSTARGLRMYLESLGYCVEVAGGVNSALEFARGWTFDVLICDLNLPDGTGWDLVTQLSKNRPIRAIAFSGLGETEHLIRSEAAGFIEHLVKGSPAEELVSAIDNALKVDLKSLVRVQSHGRAGRLPRADAARDGKAATRASRAAARARSRASRN